VAASQLDIRPGAPGLTSPASAARHEIAAFMIEEKRDVRVGLARHLA
jgi:hypothetical protein